MQLIGEHVASDSPTKISTAIAEHEQAQTAKAAVEAHYAQRRAAAPGSRLAQVYRHLETSDVGISILMLDVWRETLRRRRASLPSNIKLNIGSLSADRGRSKAATETE